ncbi:conserved hypothetical protein [Citreicella sp. SE45]|nr:conserved hypothetical protein [Citreicella sp. SE45]
MKSKHVANSWRRARWDRSLRIECSQGSRRSRFCQPLVPLREAGGLEYPP